jgi:phage head maturation protease
LAASERRILGGAGPTFNEQIDVLALADHDTGKLLGRVTPTLVLVRDTRGLRL